MVANPQWQEATIGSLFGFHRTVALSRAQLADYGEVGYIHYGDIHSRWDLHLDLARQALPGVSTDLIASADHVADGDLVLADASEDLDGVGKGVEIVGLGEKRVVSGLHTVLLRPREGVFVLGYVGLVPVTPEFRKQVQAQAAGLKVYGLSKSSLRRITIKVPPLNEQRAIAEALGDAKAAIEAMDSLIAKKREVKLAAAQGLTSGRVRLAGFDGSWESVRVAQVATVNPEALGAGTPDDFGFRYISLENVDGGLLLGWSDERFASAPSRARRVLQRGDFLFATVRPNLMGHLFFDLDEHDWICSTGFAVIRAKPAVCKPNYLSQVMLSHQVSEQVGMLISGSNYPAVSAKEVGSLTIPLPPIEEQDAIGNVLSDMDTEIDTLLAKRDKLELVKQGMMQELLSGRVRLV